MSLENLEKKISRIIDTMDCLSKSTVHIKNRDHVKQLVSELIKGTSSKLQIISDFDHTLTRVHKDGKSCTTTHGILKNPSFVSEEFMQQTARLFKHYQSIGVDPHLTKEKLPDEWYTENMSLLPISGITQDSFPEMVASSNICLRDGCDVLFESLYKNNVPLLVLSAGFGDVLKEVLKQCNVLYPNVKIIANFMRFDEKNKVIGFKDDLIYVFNKNVSSVKNLDYFNHVKSRNNVILLGDSLKDLDMTEGMQDINALLKIGFLNFKMEENLPKYLDAYDIVLSDDQTMDVVVGLLQNIL